VLRKLFKFDETKKDHKRCFWQCSQEETFQPWADPDEAGCIPEAHQLETQHDVPNEILWKQVKYLPSDRLLQQPFSTFIQSPCRFPNAVSVNRFGNVAEPG